MGAFISRLLFGENKWGKYGALLLLPNEVLFEVFKFLNRRQLTNLERVCPLFHRIINNHIGEAPFLCLGFGFSFNSSGLVTFLIDDEGKVRNKIGLKNFRFLRFKTLWMFYNGSNSISIDEKLQLLHYHLQLFETALNDLEEISLFARVNQNDQSLFRDHSQLLDHLREQVLPICHSSPAYHFTINFQSDNDAAGNVIGQILQLPSINRCQEVCFLYDNEALIQLPVEVISNWLHHNLDDQIDSTGRGKKARLLLMDHQIRIQNAVEICDRIKMLFNDADSPVHPFSFGFSGGPVEKELIENEKTNEDLFINCVDSDQDGMAVLIERSAMEKKN